ncbi:MAG: DUF4760 domain-containing protein [Candidatus Eremiobacteraeota bacterium]|nr:DUF4760 domain-containing protein [Candidatus Eremiobacteraeota bacterium]
MSLELFNSLATFGTFLVIAATAIAALVQLRHARSANQIEAINHLMQKFESADYHSALNFVITALAKKWQDPDFRYQLANRVARNRENQILISQINLVANSHEDLGLLVKRRLIERDMALDLFSPNALQAWKNVEAVAAALRRTDASAWENFEYFVVLSQDWQAAHPDGTYPPGIRRLALRDDLREVDAKYEDSLVTTRA